MQINGVFFAGVMALMSCDVFSLDSLQSEVLSPHSIHEESNLTQLKACKNTYRYDIYLSGIRTGMMQRIEYWHDDMAKVSVGGELMEVTLKRGTIESNSHASILGIGTRYHQKAKLMQSPETGDYLTTTFTQNVSGFRSRTMTATFFKNGSESEVVLNGESTHYSTQGMPLRDVDTLSVQIRHLVMQGQTQFELTRQATDGPEPYQYQVHGMKRLTLSPWGELEVIEVEQTGAEHVTFWFAPNLRYALVQAKYHGFLFDGTMELGAMTMQCR